MIFIRSLLFNVAFYLWTSVMFLLSLPALLLPAGAVWGLGRVWVCGTVLLLRIFVGLTHEVRGLAHRLPGAALYAVKHQSVDTRSSPAADRPAIVLETGLLNLPLFGWYMRKCRMIPGDRRAGRRPQHMAADARPASAAADPDLPGAPFGASHRRPINRARPRLWRSACQWCRWRSPRPVLGQGPGAGGSWWFLPAIAPGLIAGFSWPSWKRRSKPRRTGWQASQFVNHLWQHLWVILWASLGGCELGRKNPGNAVDESGKRPFFKGVSFPPDRNPLWKHLGNGLLTATIIRRSVSYPDPSPRSGPGAPNPGGVALFVDRIMRWRR
jgi:hypothetical protein